MTRAGQRDRRATPEARAPAAAELVPAVPDASRELQREAGNEAVARLLEGEALGALITPPGPGTLLAPALRATLEAAFGRDLGHVRVHEGPAARATTALLGARAFTAGRDVWLGHDAAGDTALLGHEVAHVVQQGAAPPAPHIAPNAGGAEHAAAQAGAAVAAGEAAGPVGSAPAGVQRDVDPRRRRPDEVLADPEVKSRVRDVGAEPPAAAAQGAGGKTKDPAAPKAAGDVGSALGEPGKAAVGGTSGAGRAALSDPRLSSAARLDGQAAIDSLRWWQSLRRLPGHDDIWVGTIDGREVTIPGAQLAQSSATLNTAFGESLKQIRSRADNARNWFVISVKHNEESPVAATYVYAVGELRSGFTFHRLASELPRRYHEALQLIAETEVALAAGDYLGAVEAHVRAETAAEICWQLAQAYTEQMAGSTEAIITTLRWTRTLSFVALGILATIASGGVAAGALGTATTVGGVSVGTTAAATAIATAAPIIAALGEAGTQRAIGMRVDWTKVAIDALFEVVLSRIPGGKVGTGLAKQLYRPLAAIAPIAAKTALARIGVTGLARVLEGLLLGQFQTLVKATTDEIYGKYAKPDGTSDITWGEVWEHVWQRLLEQLRDPTGWVLTVLMAAITTGADVKYGGHGLAAPPTSGGGPKKPAASTIEDKFDKPEDYEAHKAFKGLEAELPGKPATGPVVGQRLGARDQSGPEPAAAKARKPPAPQERKRVGEESAQRSADAMDELGDAARGGDPRLRAAVETSRRRMDDGRKLKSLAATGGAQPLKKAWQAYITGRPPAEITPEGFAEYVRSSSRSDRGRYGELHTAFARGPEKITVQAPEGVSESGIDSVTHEPGARTELLDNKAVKTGKRVGEVSALEWNLPKNLGETISIVEKYVAKPGVHPSVGAEALPRLKQAKQQIDKWVADNPKVKLDSKPAQAAFNTILDANQIDRVVTLGGAGTKTGITKPLAGRGFKLAPD